MRLASWKVLALVLVLYGCAQAETPSDIEYGQADGVSLRLDAYILDGRGPFPSVVFVHGGGFTGGDKRSNPKPLFDLLTQAGFNWFSINYRLSPKYTFPSHTDDVERALEFLRSHA